MTLCPLSGTCQCLIVIITQHGVSRVVFLYEACIPTAMGIHITDDYLPIGVWPQLCLYCSSGIPWYALFGRILAELIQWCQGVMWWCILLFILKSEWVKRGTSLSSNCNWWAQYVLLSTLFSTITAVLGFTWGVIFSWVHSLWRESNSSYWLHFWASLFRDHMGWCMRGCLLLGGWPAWYFWPTERAFE